MSWQSVAHILAIKSRVRRRDGARCVVCRLDAATHQKRYGQILDVHRIVPGSNYSAEWGVCVTLCDVCHNTLHGNGHWGWITKHDPDNKQQLVSLVRRSSRLDMAEEEEWRKREVWGEWLKGLRLAKLSSLTPNKNLIASIRRRKSFSPIARFAAMSNLSVKTLLDLEAGRREPLLFEAKKLSIALGISIDELAAESESDDGWRKMCEERSRRRALVFRACDPQVGEVEALSRAARLVWELVGIADEKRAEEREEVRKQAESRRREMLAKPARMIGKPAVPMLTLSGKNK
jgi:transcriptional regulator with XRE-family HTH domain